MIEVMKNSRIDIEMHRVIEMKGKRTTVFRLRILFKSGYVLEFYWLIM